jgi:hypothetical protein
LSLRRSITPFALLAALACATAPQEVPPLRLSIGVHDIAVRQPEGWMHLDHGLEHRFTQDSSHIAMADLGPATPAAFLHEINHARELFRKHQIEDAKEHLGSLRLRSALPGRKEWDEISSAYYVAQDGGLKRDSTRQEIEDSYHQLIAAIERMEPRSLEEIVESLVFELDSGAHRQLAGQQAVAVGGREGILVETWDKMTHESRRKMLLVPNEGNVLVLDMAFGRQTEMQAAFDVLVASLEFGAPAEAAP